MNCPTTSRENIDKAWCVIINLTTPLATQFRDIQCVIKNIGKCVIIILHPLSVSGYSPVRDFYGSSGPDGDPATASISRIIKSSAREKTSWALEQFLHRRSSYIFSHSFGKCTRKHHPPICLFVVCLFIPLTTYIYIYIAKALAKPVLRQLTKGLGAPPLGRSLDEGSSPFHKAMKTAETITTQHDLITISW